MSKKERLLAIYAAFLGFASLTSLVTYGVTGSFWWVETTRQDVERGLILAMLHVVLSVGGVVGTIMLVGTWLKQRDGDSHGS